MKFENSTLCWRCGVLTCMRDCVHLEFFKVVESLWPYDGPEGKIIMQLKRIGSEKFKILFYEELLLAIANHIENTLLQTQASRLVFLPISASSLFRFPSIAISHPNILVAEEMQALFTSPAAFMKTPN